VCRVW